MRFLLDTHTFVWWYSEPDQLSHRVRSILFNGQDEILLSIASIWEMQIKHQLGKLTLVRPLDEIVKAETASGMSLLPIEVEHVLALSKLPSVHRDPFDRILVSQALVENVSLVTRDGRLHSYGVPIVWWSVVTLSPRSSPTRSRASDRSTCSSAA